MGKSFLNTKYNIIQGPMAQITLGAFAGEVSKNGALGVIAGGGLDADRLQHEIRIARNITKNPIGVNVMLRSANIESLIDVILKEKVEVITYGTGDIKPFIKALKDHNVYLIALVNTVEKAIQAEKDGADMLVCEGTEAGGHVGKVTTFTLIPQVVDAVQIPVFAAGGIADKRGVNAALALGAQGVQVGTRFIASYECPLPEAYKNAILMARDVDTTITGRKFGSGVRVLNNKMAQDYINLEYSDASFDDLEKITKGSLKRSVIDGDIETGSVMMGQVSGLIHDILSIEDIIQSLID
mgnify:FL=1